MLRFAYLGILLGILSLTWYGNTQSYQYQSESIVQQAQEQAQLGRFFFIAFSLFSIGAMQLIGPVLTSTAIGSEKLKRTLDVLLMTPISSWQIVAGKLFSRLLTALILIGLTLPVLAIVRLLGGVEIADMFGVLALSACTAMSAAAIGLLLSCWIKRAWAVILLSYMIMAAVFYFLPLIIVLFLQGIFRFSTGASAFWIIKALVTFNPSSATFVNSIPGVGLSVDWTSACLVQLITAGVLILAASNVVRRYNKKESAGDHLSPTPIAAAILADPQNPILSAQAGKERHFELTRPTRPRFTSNYPILQYELSRPLFNKVWQRTTATTVVLMMLFLSYLGFAATPGLIKEDEVQIGYAVIMFTLFSAMCIILSSTAIANEKESDTWTLLIVSPVTGNGVLWGKYVGILRRMIWPLVLIFCHFGIFALFGVISLFSWMMVLWVTITFNSVWIATGIYLSLRSKKVTSAVVFNLLLALSIYLAAPMVMSVAEVRNTERVLDMSELCYYWLPYWYLVEGILNPRQLHTRSFSIPVLHEQARQYYIFFFAFVAGMAHLLLTLVIMFYTSRRFNKMVERAS